MDGVACARLARDRLESCDAVLVHFDVDSIDSADLPLANFPHYGTGVPLETAEDVLATLLETDQLAAIALTEVNPTYDPGGEQLARYVELVSAALLRGLGPRP